MKQDTDSLTTLLKEWRSKILVGALLGFGVVLSLGFYADAEKLGASLIAFDWTLLPIIMLFVCLGYVGRFLKWQLYMKELKIAISWADSARIFFSGLSMALTPGKLGEVLKSILLQRTHGIAFFRSAPTLFAERLTDLFAMLLLALAGIWQAAAYRPMILAGILFLVSILFLISQREFCERFLAKLNNFPIVGRYVVPLQTMYETSHMLLRGRLLLYSLLISAIAWFMECLALYYILQGLGVRVSLSWTTFTFSVGSIAGGLSMLPGGLGAAEVSMLGLLLLTGIDRPVAVSATVLARFGTLWFGLFLGMIVLGGSLRRFLNAEKSQGNLS